MQHFENEQASLVVAGKQYAAHNTERLDWYTGERSKVQTAHPVVSHYQLTKSGRVLTGYQGYLLLHDPRRDESLLWDSGLSIAQARLTADEAYLVANDTDGACRVWRVPETQAMGSCGAGNPFSSGRALLELAGHSFATTRNNRVALYTLAPYERRFVREMPKDIVALDLTENGLLALADETGRIELWDTRRNRLLGHYQPRGSQGQALDHVEKLALDASGKLLVSAINLQGRQEARLLLLEPAATAQP
ncbi:hypothetical protein [Pseudomonas sp. RIT-PI-AD]|uniref:hypothetical protein n=1 Tax=Pseudomonas sp. RIT-PI-AD TaxID=3035294 RepID=UPI0021D94CA1|nr:hypothetical protein [Pseudomonas sp. RIT-PI-AD]